MKKSKKFRRLKKSVNFKRAQKQWHQHKLRLLVIVCGVFVISLAGIAYIRAHTAEPGRLVTFNDRGQNHVIFTRATTVRAALNDANINVDPRDDVEPAINSALLSTDSDVIIYRARPVLVIDGALRDKVVTAAASPNEIATAAGVAAVAPVDKTSLIQDINPTDGFSEILTIQRAIIAPAAAQPNLFKPTPLALSKSKGAQIYTDSSGVAHRETYYDLPMNLVMGACGSSNYTIRYDGAKIDKDGYVLVAANLYAYPRCSVVETSLGLGKVYDTGGFAARYPHGFDLATDWTNYDGR